MRKRPARRAGLMPSGRALSGIDFVANKKQRAAINWNYAVTLHVALIL
jgi:hypothetical protein